MAARAIGSGTISFGLVAIPVKLFSTVDSTKAIRFNYLTEDGARVKQQYISQTDGEVVERADLVQGYEFAKGQYVLFTPEEIKAMNVEATNAIDIQEFVPLAEIERIYIDKVYYLGPDKGAARSYHLLKEALIATKRAALAQYAARGKSYLVLVRPMDDGLIMEQLKHESELRTFEDVPLDVCDIAESELDLAIKIIDQRVNDEFEPGKYEDEVRSRIMELIEQKVEGQEIAMPPAEQPEAKIIDLMEALKASVSGKSLGGKAGKSGVGKSVAGKPVDKTTGTKNPARKSAGRAGKSAAKTATTTGAKSKRKAR